jgi:flagellar basal-body rod protein FlgC
MDFLSAMHVSASGLSAERTRLDIATSNLANAESTRTADGGPYKRLDPVFEAVHIEEPGHHGEGGVAEVQVAHVVQDETPGKRVYSPGHPDADADGFLTLPNVDPVHEVVNLMSASRGYEANVTAIETLKTMAQRALDLAS